MTAKDKSDVMKSVMAYGRLCIETGIGIANSEEMMDALKGVVHSLDVASPSVRRSGRDIMELIERYGVINRTLGAAHRLTDVEKKEYEEESAAIRADLESRIDRLMWKAGEA